jgi:hypothetical protein
MITLILLAAYKENSSQIFGMYLFAAEPGSPGQQAGRMIVMRAETKFATYLGDILFAAVPKSSGQ